MTQIDIKFALNELEITGFYIVKNYFDINLCKEIIDTIDQKINKFSKGDGMDFRHYHFENESEHSRNFLMDHNTQQVCDEYMKLPLIEKRCQAGLVIHDKNSKNSSGGGWHVDKRSKQFKAILYLSSVTEDNGYFSIIPKTNFRLSDFNTCPKFDGDNSMTRFEVLELIKKDIFNNRIKILGNPGDLILVDTSNIHRGEEILNGKRYSLTNYYYN